MNSDLLLTHFHRITDAPNSGISLRQFIVDLAIHGKLVEQDPAEESASDLVKRIHKEKLRLVSAGELPTLAPLPAIRTEELPFVAPDGWTWARLASLSTRIHYGYTASADASIEAVKMLRITDIQNNSVKWSTVPGCEIREREIPQYKLHDGDVLIARTGGTIGKTFLVEEIPVVAVFASYLIRVRRAPEMCARYLKLFLESSIYWKQLGDGARGGGQPNVNGKTLGRMTVPVPPLAEQLRIVSKVDEAMVFCAKFEAAAHDRKRQRERLTAAVHRGIAVAVDAAGTQKDIRFLIDNLPEVTAEATQIASLRETILSLAVKGFLSDQDETEKNPAESLYAVSLKKQEMVKEGKLRKEKALAIIGDSDQPFRIPSNWSWARIGTIALFTDYGTSVQTSQTDTGVPVLKMGDIQEGQVILGGQKMVPEQIGDLPALFLKRFDLLYNRTNSAELVGKTGIYLGDDNAYTFASYLIRIRLLDSETDPAYINLAMNAPYFRATQIIPELQQQCGQANVNGTKLRNMLIPLPPIAEQRRIVSKVSQLTVLADGLERRLRDTEELRSSLTHSILRNTLENGQNQCA